MTSTEPALNQSGLVEPDSRIGTGTTSFALADTDGNMIVFTQTLSTWGGNYYVSKGLGFLYNNHLRSNRTTPGAYGSLLPLMRSSMPAYWISSAALIAGTDAVSAAAP